MYILTVWLLNCCIFLWKSLMFYILWQVPFTKLCVYFLINSTLNWKNKWLSLACPHYMVNCKIEMGGGGCFGLFFFLFPTRLGKLSKGKESGHCIIEYFFFQRDVSFFSLWSSKTHTSFHLDCSLDVFMWSQRHLLEFVSCMSQLLSVLSLSAVLRYRYCSDAVSAS